MITLDNKKFKIICRKQMQDNKTERYILLVHGDATKFKGQLISTKIHGACDKHNFLGFMETAIYCEHFNDTMMSIYVRG